MSSSGRRPPATRPRSPCESSPLTRATAAATPARATVSSRTAASTARDKPRSARPAAHQRPGATPARSRCKSCVVTSRPVHTHPTCLFSFTSHEHTSSRVLLAHDIVCKLHPLFFTLDSQHENTSARLSQITVPRPAMGVREGRRLRPDCPGTHLARALPRRVREFLRRRAGGDVPQQRRVHVDSPPRRLAPRPPPRPHLHLHHRVPRLPSLHPPHAPRPLLHLPATARTRGAARIGVMIESAGSSFLLYTRSSSAGLSVIPSP